MDPMAPTDEAPGTSGEPPDGLVDGRYRLEALLGRGGMAAVYQALDTRLDRRVAIKMLTGGPGADERRFRAEVRTLARFSHPNLVRLYDAGEIDGRLYLVMELVEGATLAARLRDGPVATADTATIGADVAGALAYVHGQGIVHRDIKPANILLATGGSAYLADFGIARLVDTARMTATGLLVGTPAYLAPEQIDRRQVGGPADVFALGLVLAECLSGERAFAGTLSEIAADRALRDPKIPNDLDSRLASLLRSMTARDPAQRPTAPEVAVELSAWRVRAPAHAGGRQSGALTTIVGETRNGATERLDAPDPTLAATAVAPTAVAPPDPRPSTRSRDGRWTTARGRALVLVGAALVVALLVGLVLGGLVFSSGPSGSRQHDPGSAAGSKKTVASTTTTSTTTTSTTTTLPAPSLATAVGDLVSGLVTGVHDGNVSSQAGQQLMGQLQALSLSQQAGPSDQQVGQFDQFVQSFDQDVANGQITGSQTISSLTQSIDTLAAALGTSVPSATTPPPPGPPGGKKSQGKKGNGNGHS